MEDNGAILHAAALGKKSAIEAAALCPQLQDQDLYDAFNDLGTSRLPCQGAISCIPIDKIAWYPEHYNYDPLDAEAFEYIIRKVDIAYTNKVNARIQKAAKAT